jgi:phosphatidylglycerophosphatase A
MNGNIARLLATWFRIGDLPMAPGTFASAVGLLIAVLFSPFKVAYIAVALTITALGFMASGPAEKVIGKKDPGSIVIDEVAGIMIAFFLLPVRVDVLFVTFFLFRAFDMFKIYPVNEFEKYEAGVGIMMDDIIAGIYTNLIMHAALRLAA